MTRLDAIKERAKVVATKPENREATYAEFGAVLRLACFDVPALASAIEAVLALHRAHGGYTECVECGYEAPCPTVEAIRDALGEDA